MDEKTPLAAGGTPNYSGGYGNMSGYPQGGAPGPYPPQGGPSPQGGAGYPQPQGGAPGPYPPQGGPPPQGGAGYPQPQGGAPGPYPPQGGPPPQGAAPGYQQGGAPPAGAVPEKGDDPEPSAPPLESMDQVPGYSNIGFDGSALPPPSYDEAMSGPPPERQDVKSAPTITEEDAREALLTFVSEHCCYGAGPARDMKFSDLRSSSAFHYTLETFGEGRSTKWAFQPYRGEGVSVTGPPPGPWDIQANPPQMFATKVLDVEVPNTASVKPCYNCQGSGYKRCRNCWGSGRERCTTCHGTGRESYYEDGRHHHRNCPWCMGGFKTCWGCNGSGRITCRKCEGRANLRWFIQLTIKWTNHLEDYIVERTALPDELIRSVSGQVAFEETNPRVWPVNHFPEQAINTASNNLVTKHGQQFPSERILMQRHRVRIIPVTEVPYKHKDNSGTFFVYGFEHRVYAPDYPAKCCCGCSIL